MDNKKKENYIGKSFNRFTIISYAKPLKYTSKTGKKITKTIVNCQCSCGNLWTGRLESIKNGNTLSCGCHKKENPGRKTHGLRKTSEYKSWAQMKERCFNKNNPRYADYGGRGITICDRWLSSFENFLEDMGRKLSKNHSLDRINNNSNYCKENCRWTTVKMQNNNQRSNKTITYMGKTQNMKQWCEELKLNYGKVSQRLRKLNWSIEEAFKN